MKTLLVTVLVSLAGYATAASNCPQHYPNGTPPEVDGTSGGSREVCFTDFAVLHSSKLKTPVYSVQRLDKATMERAKDVPREGNFYAEARLPSAERATPQDYRGSGYDRGHMSPAATMPSREGMAQSFSMANMVPQNPNLNRGTWKQVETAVQKYAERSVTPVYVFTGPVYLQGSIASIGNGVAVPSHVFKAVIDPNGKSYGWVLPNESGVRMSAPMDIGKLSDIVGINFNNKPNF